MNNICGLCGAPLTSLDTLLGGNKLADGYFLCNKCLNQATEINKDVVDNLGQLFLPEIRGIILQGKIGEFEAPTASQGSEFRQVQNQTQSFGFGGTVTRLDMIQDQIVALNARLSVFANAEVKELVNVLAEDEKLTAIAEGLTVPDKVEGLIFSTQKRVVFIDKKFFGNIQQNEYLYPDISSVDHIESLLYSTLKIYTKSGGSAEFKLHNKSDARNFCNAVNTYISGSGKRFADPNQQEQQQIQATSFNMYNLPISESVFPQNSAKPTAQNSAAKKESAEMIFEQLEKLGKLRETGILTEEEFVEQKKKLLERL
jgi:hypothetical protein